MIQQHPAEPHQGSEPEQITFTFDDRQWRIRGLEKQLSCERLRVNLLVARRELVHVDTLDLYVARQRHTFLRQAAAELYVEEATIKRDLGRVLLQLEARQELLIREQLGPRTAQVPVMSQAERKDALQLLKDPQLIERILQDYDACGLVGEETNKLVCYLACTSRLLPQPLSVLVQSSSAAGKTSLVEATLQLMPAEAQVRLSALTSQSLYYMGAGELQHKILAIAEEAGVADWDRRKADFGPQATAKVVQYLANYVGRIALSDSRILDIQGDHVLFQYKDYRDNNQQKTEWIEGVELIHRFLQHLLPPGFRHIRRYGWMGPRVKPEKRDFIRSYHGLDDVPASESQDEADGEAARAEEVSTQTCRFCAGDMHLTGSTVRPRVSELLAMPLSRFRQAQAGFTVTLGDRLPQIEAQRVWRRVGSCYGREGPTDPETTQRLDELQLLVT